VYEPVLAKALNDLAVDLAVADRGEEAVVAVGQAVGIRRRLARADPGQHQGDLALSLVNLGTYLSGYGRQEEAEAAADEARRSCGG
jgi:Tetratricopeptide repeat